MIHNELNYARHEPISTSNRGIMTSTDLKTYQVLVVGCGCQIRLYKQRATLANQYEPS